MNEDLLERVIRLFARDVAVGNFAGAERWAHVAASLWADLEAEGSVRRTVDIGGEA